MNPVVRIARRVALALLDGEWKLDAIGARLLALGGLEDEDEDEDGAEGDEEVDDEDRGPRWWAFQLLQDCAQLESPTRYGLTAWLLKHPAFAALLATRWRPRPVWRALTARPEMSEQPWSVPVLTTHRDLADWLAIDREELTVLADRRSISRTSREERHRHYRYAWIPKPRGGHRLVEAPKPRLRAVQRAILDGIVGAITPHDAAYGFRAGRSVVDAARRHVGRAVVLRVDLQSFFTSVFAARVAGILRTAGYPEDVAYTLSAMCTHRPPREVLAGAPADARGPLDLARLRTPHLPQGAPTSGALANLAAYRLDVRVAAFAAKLGATYTRYADDLVLSSDDRGLARAATTVVARLATIAEDEGFSLNFRKTRVMTSGGRQRVTGIVVNEKVGVARADVDQLRAILHNCARLGPATQNRDGHADFRAHLRGRVAWIASLDARKGERLRAMFERIRWD